MKTLIYGTIIYAIIFNIGCSTTIEPVKPITEIQSTTNEQPLIKTETEFRDLGSDENFFTALSYQCFFINSLQYDIQIYRQVFGNLPEDIQTLVDSGFLLWWPRNMFDGTPVKVVKNRSLVMDRTDLGAFKYDILSNPPYNLTLEGVFNCGFKLNQLRLDYEEFEEAGTEKWTETYSEFPGGRSLDESTVRVIEVIYGKKPIYEIKDDKIRLIYGLCAGLSSILHTQMGFFYQNHERLPNNLSDLMDDNILFIKENIAEFATLLGNSDAEYKWGIDYANGVSYFTLQINGETFISGCRIFGDVVSLDVPGHIGFGINIFCEIDDGIDMSTPIIANSNLGNLEIPELMISRDDIPIGN